MVQQKQRKQLILTDNKNISTCPFQPIQSLQPNFMTDDIRNFMYTIRNGDNTKLRIFSFIPQRQRKQPNFMNDSIATFIHTKQPNTYTQPEQPTTTLTWVSPRMLKSFILGFTSNKKFMLLQLMA